MNTGYSNYLFYVVVFSILFMILLLYLVVHIGKKKKKKKPPEPWELEAIKAGSISVFFDSGKNMTALPYVRNKYGIGRAVANPQYLKYPYSVENAGRLIRYTMRLSSTGVPGTGTELMASLGVGDWLSFSSGKKNISVHYDEKQGIVMSPTWQRGEGIYEFIEGELTLDGKAADKEIGEFLMTVLSRCK